MAEYFTSDHFLLLDKWAGQKRDETSAEQNRAYESLADAYQVTEAWAQALKAALFPNGRVKIRKRPTSQANTFLPYNWARIYPTPNAPEEVAYTVGIDAQDGFVVKIDTVQADSSIRTRYEHVRGTYDSRSPIVSILPVAEGLSKSSDELLAWSVDAIQNFQVSYDDVVAALDLPKWKNDAASDGEVARHGSQEAITRRRFWIEKTIVNGRSDRLQGEHALGRALWSPERSKDGKDIYANMRQVCEGDVVFHLVDNDAITAVSLAAGIADKSFVGLEGSDWAGQAGYRIPLKDHEALSPSLSRDAFLTKEPFATELKELAESGARGLFYNSRRGLNQGAYLTEATPTLISILNRAYHDLAGRGLPYVDGDVGANEQARSYTLDDALLELFLSRNDAEDLLLLWRAKKNIVLQGPPGVGKSFAAHKLAFALMGAEDRQRVGFVQFHQSYSYEDFVEGYRPTAAGFDLKAGKFVEFCRRAEADINRTYVFIIDEINRGNLGKILGELILLIESDKRDSNWAMPLASGKAPFHVPANVYLMGLMNTADRSLAVVDYALWRRFGFVDIKPSINSPRFDDHLGSLGVSVALRDSLRAAVQSLNNEIVADKLNLGPGFAIGHSFFCAGPSPGETETSWYQRIVRTELLPLLREYWFDAPEKAEVWGERLMAFR